MDDAPDRRRRRSLTETLWTRPTRVLQRLRRAGHWRSRGIRDVYVGMPSGRDMLAAEVARLTRSLRDAQQQREALAAHARRLDDALQRLDRHIRSADYHADHLAVWHRNVGFLNAPAFVRAYRRGMDSGHKMGRPEGSTADIHIEWRVHVVCWAAWHARHLPGAYVECGVNTGVYSLAVCEFIDFNATGKDFYLFDTYGGIPESQVPEEDRERVARLADLYDECYALARQNFAPFPRARLVRGIVPESLTTVAIDRVCYLSIDMNVAEPEVAALAHFWDRLSPGAPVILDDYGWTEHARQYEALNRFARLHDVRIATLPTGQGLLLRP